MHLRKILFAVFLFTSVSAVAADGFKNEELLNLQVMARFDFCDISLTVLQTGRTADSEART